MAGTFTYGVKQFDLSGLNGISDKTLEMHFKLYEGYVKNTNKLNERMAELLSKGKTDAPDYPDMTRQLGFEYNGMVLHEYYFANLKRAGGGDPGAASAFRKAAQESYQSYENWKADFVATGALRGVGWAVCYQDPSNGRVSNHWITLHQDGNIAGYRPILVMDVWEHAFILDYKPAERPKYIEAFFSNIDWAAVDGRLAR
jgi:Fe-Mn family superoxide dismutase